MAYGNDDAIRAVIGGMPHWLRGPLESLAADRWAALQRLRRARWMATAETGPGRGTADRADLAGQRAALNLDAARLRERRAAWLATVRDFERRARDAGEDAGAILAYLRRSERDRLRDAPGQFLARGFGYYPSAAESGRARREEAAQNARDAAPFRAELREAAEAKAAREAAEAASWRTRQAGWAARGTARRASGRGNLPGIHINPRANGYGPRCGLPFTSGMASRARIAGPTFTASSPGRSRSITSGPAARAAATGPGTS